MFYFEYRKRLAERFAKSVFTTLLATWAVFCTAGAFAGETAESMTVLPAKISLAGPQSQQTLLVQEVRDGKFGLQLTKGVQFEISDTKVIRVEKGVIFPVGNGRATITAKVGGRSERVKVTVTGQNVPQEWLFRNHVQSILSKAGCNSGACHGALAGKNGFKLSLRGYDPQFDFHAITRQSGGRRIVPSDPGRSLLLTKPTGVVPHKGGVRLEVGSREFRVLAEWLATGQKAPAENDPRMTRLDILPKNVVLKPGVTQQFVIMAHFSDGHVEDVTQWARYTSTNLSVAKVDEFGKIEITGSGEGAIVAWYLATNSVASVTVPYPSTVPSEVFAKSERNNFIDELVLAKLKNLNIPPSKTATDSEFIRRAYLDTIGVLPTIANTREFLANTKLDKRGRLADELLARPEFVDYWTYKWSDLLLVSGARLRPKAVESYYKWVRRHVSDNTPWDRFVREVVTAKGSTLNHGEANFYSLHEDPLDMSETVSMAFLGMSIGCARCHDHPLEKWTNDDYYGMASLFSRVRGKGWAGDGGSGDGNRSVFSATEGELIQPRTGRPQQPRPLDGKPIAFESTEDRRVYLAQWLTSSQNPYFSRAIVNRVWANFMGVGIVEKIDDLRLTNPPSNEALLTALSNYLGENNYDLKKLMRLILTSAAYQRSSVFRPGNENDERFYSRFYPRRLKAEILLDAFSQVTKTPSKFKGYPEGTRALQLRDTNVGSYFLNRFGRPERKITCECERSDEPTMVQVLHIMNGVTINKKLSAEKSRVGWFISEKTPYETIIEDVYLSALCRLPTPAEKSGLMKILGETKPDEQRAVLEDLFWSILSSKEFLFNH